MEMTKVINNRVIKPPAKTKVQHAAKLNQSQHSVGELFEVTGGRVDEIVTRLVNHVLYPETGKRGKPRQRKTRAKVKEKQTAFLRAFGDSCDLAGAAHLAGIELATHYRWLARDTAYKDEFEATIPMALGALEDSLTDLARHGWFQPLIYQGELQYAWRRRTLCQLTDGTTVFEDELPKGALVTGRRTVSTHDGEMLGTHRIDQRLLLDVAAKWMPERYGRQPAREQYGTAPRFTAQPADVVAPPQESAAGTEESFVEARESG
jgi:hypothetical protein